MIKKLAVTAPFRFDESIDVHHIFFSIHTRTVVVMTTTIALMCQSFASDDDAVVMAYDEECEAVVFQGRCFSRLFLRKKQNFKNSFSERGLISGKLMKVVRFY